MRASVHVLESGYNLFSVNQTKARDFFLHFGIYRPRSKLFSDMTHKKRFHQIRDFVLFMKQQGASQHVQDNPIS